MNFSLAGLDVTLFQGIGPGALAFVVFAYCLGFFIRGAFGFGSNMPIVLMTTWVLSPHHAILLVTLTAIASQVALMPQGIRTADWRVARPLSFGIMVGIVVGTVIFVWLDANKLALVMGALVVFILLADRVKLLERLSHVVDMRGRVVNLVLAMVSATIGSISGGGTIYFLVVYLRRVCATPESLRGTNIAVSGIFVLGRLVAVTVAGLIDLALLVDALLLLPAVFFGIWCGTKLFRATSPARFYAALQVLLIGAAVAMIARAIADLV